MRGHCLSQTRLGAILWTLCPQYFVAEALTASAWGGGYRFRTNFISDLGAVRCDAVCSPWHSLMNASFVAQGFLMIGGAALLHPAFRRRAFETAALLLTATAGLGVIGVGAAPEDFAPGAHYVSAGVNIVGANAAMICMGVALRAGGARALSWLPLVLGLAGFVALTALVSKADDGLGIGVVERIAADPFALWLALLGALSLRGRLPIAA